MTGDFRFRTGYCKSNPRKMVKLWAEKEMRNLIRLAEAGIRCPAAHQLQMHVLVMGFIGSGDVAAPRLKDADLPLVRVPPAACRAVAAPAHAYKFLLGLPRGQCACFELRHHPSGRVLTPAAAASGRVQRDAADHADTVPAVSPRAWRPQRVQHLSA